ESRSSERLERSSQRSYDHAIREFIDWYCSEPRMAGCRRDRGGRQTVMRRWPARVEGMTTSKRAQRRKPETAAEWWLQVRLDLVLRRAECPSRDGIRRA